MTIRLNKNDENIPPTVYHLSDDGKALVVVLDEFDEPDDKGITQHGRLESVFEKRSGSISGAEKPARAVSHQQQRKQSSPRADVSAPFLVGG